MATPTALDYRSADTSLVANGATVTIGPLTVTLAGFDLVNDLAQCQLFDGRNSTGNTNFGPVDAGYVMTSAQLTEGSRMTA